eukprot:363424-Chlamydomonas_euryale.AAC.4
MAWPSGRRQASSTAETAACACSRRRRHGFAAWLELAGWKKQAAAPPVSTGVCLLYKERRAGELGEGGCARARAVPAEAPNAATARRNSGVGCHAPRLGGGAAARSAVLSACGRSAGASLPLLHGMLHRRGKHRFTQARRPERVWHRRHHADTISQCGGSGRPSCRPTSLPDQLNPGTTKLQSPQALKCVPQLLQIHLSTTPESTRLRR